MFCCSLFQCEILIGIIRAVCLRLRLMAWYSGTGRENHKSLWDEPVKDRCIFCGSIEEVKCQMTIVFSEFETNTGNCCKRCYAANAKQAKAI